MIEERLGADIEGRVIAPGDPDYDTARTVMMGGIDRHPAAVVRVANAADVARVVRHARETGVEVAVRCGGHSGAGHSTTEGGIVIDLRDMKGLRIDPEARVAWAEGGLTAAEVTAAVAEHGLAIGFGDTGSVGIGGITLGGGMGYLSRRDGLTIDNLIGAEIVTADSEILEVDGEHHPDLFWAIRGGGGNLGVATRFTYRLTPLGQVVGGMLVLPATAEAVTGFIAAAAAAPDELSTIANIMPAPPMPFLDESIHGKVVILGMIVFSGDPADADRVLAPFRSLADPLADMLRPMAYPEMYPPEEGAEEYHPLAIARTLFMRSVDRDVAQTIVEQLEASDAPMRAVQLRVLGGAIARVPADATAYAHRSMPILANVAAFYEGPADRSRKETWVTDLSAALNQGLDGAYVNFVGDEGAAGVHAAYPKETWDRLAAVKARYDPGNLFRLNQNVPPSSS